MRLKSFFTILLATICTAAINAQDPAGPLLTKELRSNAPVLYSNAPMYVAPNPTDADKAVMFISGSASFANEAEIVQQGITSLSGDFVNVKYLAGTATSPLIKSLFVTPDLVAGSVRFVGQWNKQSIVRGKVYENVANPSVLRPVDEKMERPEYVLNFPEIEVRKEGVKELQDLGSLTASQGWYKPWTAGDALFTYNPIEFGVVHVATNIAISVEKLDVVGGNRFTVDVASDGLDPFGTTTGQVSSDYYRLNSGFADIRGVVEESVGKIGGYHEVDMTKLYNYNANKNGLDPTKPGLSEAQSDALVIASNTIPVGSTHATFMRGFTSPFDKLHTDHLFYHVLTQPSPTSITGGLGPIGAPKMELIPGKGYFHAMDVSGAYFEKIDGLWTTDHKLRHRGGYNLSRLAHEWHDRKKTVKADGTIVLSTTERNNLSLFTISTADAGIAPPKGGREIEEQRFNIKDVVIVLGVTEVGNTKPGARRVPGVNFLANPFMTPISLNSVLLPIDGDDAKMQPVLDALTEGDLVVPFATGPVGGSNVLAVHKLDYNNKAIEDAIRVGNVLIRSAYWLVNSAFVTNVTLQGLPFYAYNVKYDFIDLASSAKTVGDVQDHYIEPMQMFLLQVANGGKFTFTKEMKATKGQRFPTMLGAGKFVPTEPLPVASARAMASAADVQADDKIILPDWFVVEAVVGDNELTVDRTAVRFFETASLGYDSHHDQVKTLTQPQATAIRSDSRVGEIGEDVVPKNVIYTSTPQKDALLANCINYTTKEIPLSYIPGEKEQNVTFTVHGLEGLDKVQGVWLIDKENNTKQDLLQDNEYTFLAKPVDKPLEADNRFILRFYDDDGEGPEEPSVTEKPITCYYSGSTLHIGGLNEKDLGSLVQIFDLQGRMMGNTTITNHPSMEYQKTLGQGTFIVKITGERNYTTKFVNIQNY